MWLRLSVRPTAQSAEQGDSRPAKEQRFRRRAQVRPTTNVNAQEVEPLQSLRDCTILGSQTVSPPCALSWRE